MDRSGQLVTVTVGSETLELPVDAVESLQAGLEDALTKRREFLHTAGQHREDGTYVVERRGADSTGNSKVFDSFELLERMVDRLPDELTAEDLSRVGLTGGRRHMVLWHLVEHPGFDYQLTSRQPLRARRGGDT